MIIRIFRSGISNGIAPVEYILGDTDHTGQIRAVQPEILDGNSQTTIDIINSIQRKHKYISGAIAFRDTEKPTSEQMTQIIDQFKETFCAGLTGENFNSLFVLHRDKGNDEIHFVIPTQEMRSGKRLNIHPPGKRNLQFFEAFTRVMNHDLGYAQVVTDPLKLAFSDFERKTPEGRQDRQQKALSHSHILKVVRSGQIRNRTDLCHSLEKDLGIRVTRKGGNYISVIFPGAKRAKRLTGEVYAENADYVSLTEQSRKAGTPHYLTPEECQQERTRLHAFIGARREFNTKAYLSPKPMRHRRTKSISTYRVSRAQKAASPIKIQLNEKMLQSMHEIRAKYQNPSTASISQTGSGTIQTASQNKKHPAQDSNSPIAGQIVGRNSPATNSTLNSLRSATQAVSMAEISLADALALLAQAKTPELWAQANQAVINAQARLRDALARLALAKIRAASSTPTTMRKIR